MSSTKKKFVERFIEICGTDQPKEVSELLNIHYNSAKNYLNGRLPDSKALLNISDRTPYSIHWLLTGKGEKFVDESIKNDLEILVDNLTEIADREFLFELVEFVKAYNLKNKHTNTVSPKMVILPNDKIREEKAKDKESSDLPPNSSESQ